MLYIAGYAAILVALGAASIALIGGRAEASGAPSTTKGTVDIAVGVLLLLLVLRMLLNAPDPNAPPPKWLARLNSIGPGGSFLFGVAMLVFNFSTLALFIPAVGEIASAHLSAGQSAIALALLVLLVISTLLLPVAFYAVQRQRAAAVLASLRHWLGRHNRVIMIILLAIFGLYLVEKGLRILL